MARADITALRVRELLVYDELTGTFRNRIDRRGCTAGAISGCIATRYCYISVDGHSCAAHRLAWLYVHGQWPKHAIDHIDGNCLNNAIANLRDVSLAINQQNRTRRQKNNTSGFPGVSRRGKLWCAFISVGGKSRNLGYFKTAQDAHAKYIEAKRIHHPGFKGIGT